MRRFLCFVGLLTLAAVTSAVDASAQSPFISPGYSPVYSPTGWSPVIVPRGAYRAEIRSMPIEQRPGRPFHVYGNTIRMMDQSRRHDAPIRPLRQIFFGTVSRPSR